MNRKRQLIIKKIATPQNTLLLGLLFLIMVLFIMPEATKQIKLCSFNTGLIDGIFYHTPEQVYNKIFAYGEKGRKLYVAVELTADLFLYIVIAAFLSSVLILMATKSHNKAIQFKYLFWLPASAMIANFLENGMIILMLVIFPKKYFFIAIFTSIFAFFKWFLIILCLIILFWNLVRIGMMNITMARNTKREKITP